MATFQMFDEFGNHLLTGVHNLSTGALKWALTNTAPDGAANTVLANITQISGTNGYTTGGSAAPSVTIAETVAGNGIWRLSSGDTVFTASGGPIGPFRYAVLYNDTPTSPVDPLIGFVDYGSNITVSDTNTFTIDVGANGIYTLTVP